MFHNRQSPDVETVSFSGTEIKVLELKRSIVEIKKFSQGMNFDLTILDAENLTRGREKYAAFSGLEMIIQSITLFGHCVGFFHDLPAALTFNKKTIDLFAFVHIYIFFAAFSDDNSYIPKNTTVVVKRKPVPSGGIGLMARLQGGVAAVSDGSWRAP
jgi:hypothetical protein